MRNAGQAEHRKKPILPTGERFSARFHTWGSGAAPHGPRGDLRRPPLAARRQPTQPRSPAAGRAPSPHGQRFTARRPRPGLWKEAGAAAAASPPPAARIYLAGEPPLHGPPPPAPRFKRSGWRATERSPHPPPGSRYTSPTPSESGAGGRHLSSGSETAPSTQTPSDPGPSRDTVSWHIALPPHPLLTLLPGPWSRFSRLPPAPCPALQGTGRRGSTACAHAGSSRAFPSPQPWSLWGGGSGRWGAVVEGGACDFGSSPFSVGFTPISVGYTD